MKLLTHFLFSSIPFLVASQSPAYWDGNNDAAAQWDKKPYECTLSGVSNDFWDDVQRKVYPKCSDKYSIFPKSLRECKEGAKAYTITRANDCAKDYECKAIGGIAAGSVADMYCPRRPPRKSGSKTTEPPPLIPPRCEKKAIEECRDTIEDEVGDRINDGICNDLSLPLGSRLRKKLKKHCDRVVKDLVEQAALP